MKIWKNWKKICAVLTLLVAVLLCMTACGDQTVAEPLELDELFVKPQYCVQELRVWGQGQVSLADKPLEMDGYRIYMYKLDTDLLEAYIAMLQQNGFTLVDEHHQSSFLGSYQSYGLRCDAASDVDTRGMMYTGTPCHVNIWQSDRKWRVEVVDGIDMYDLGLRQDGSREEKLLLGESLGAGLRGSSGGKYTTEDGRLKAEQGQATVLLEGKLSQVEAEWRRSGERIFVTVNLPGDLSVGIEYNEKEVEQGDVFLLNAIEEQPAKVTVEAGSKKITAQQTGGIPFHFIALRIMHMGQKGDVVLYLYAEPRDSSKYPQSLELLCAVNTTPEKKEESNGGGGIRYPWEDDEPFQPNHSKLDCLTCRGSGDCTTCGGDGYTDFGDAKGGCRSCHGDGNCRSCGGSGKR